MSRPGDGVRRTAGPAARLLRALVRLVRRLQPQPDRHAALHSQRLELERARHGFVALLEAVPDAACIVASGGRIVACNRAAGLLLGYAPGTLLDVQVESLLPDAMRAAHVDKRARFEFAPHTRSMGAGNNTPLPCRRHDGSVVWVHISLGSLVFEGQQCAVTFLRPVAPEPTLQADPLLPERCQLLEVALERLPGLLFSLRRQADGSYGVALRSAACAQALQIDLAATAQEWVKQWFNRVLPMDLPQLLAALEAGALQEAALQLQWRHHVVGRGVQGFALGAGRPLRASDGSLCWACLVSPLDFSDLE